MAVPNHRPNCQTMIWRTNCPDCGSPVYFFSCSCGSKVYFDLPRPPWNPHADRCIQYLVRTLIDLHNYHPAQVLATVSQRANELDLPIPPELEQHLVNMSQRSRPGLIVHEVLPGEDNCMAIGNVLELNLQVNFFKRFRYDDNPISRGLLGILVKESYVEMTVRTDPEPGTRDCHQFKFFYPRAKFNQTHIRQNGKVGFVLEPHSLPNGTNIWIAIDVQDTI